MKVQRERWRFAVIALAGAAIVASCSSVDRPGELGGTNGSDASAGLERCSPGTSRACTITLGRNGNVITCYKGVQTCDRQGGWGACRDGSVTTQSAPPLSNGALRVLDTTVPSPCVDNPCDPTCQVFGQTPDGGITVDGSVGGISWLVGDRPTLFVANPPGVAFNEPCGQSQDCQFDTRCTEPETSGSCAHEKCTTGIALTSTCDSCVTKICATNPSCCATPVSSGSCSHSVCLQGPSLDSSCSACTTQVCKTTSGCCSCGGSNGDPCTSQGSTGDRLDPRCDPQMTTACAANRSCCTTSCDNGQTAASGKKHPAYEAPSAGLRLDPGCDSDNGNLVSSVCAQDPTCCTTYVPPAACAHDPCSTGTSLGGACSSNVAAVCASDATCCSTSWTASCVTAYKAQTGYSCSTTWSTSCRDKYLTAAAITTGDRQTKWNSTCKTKFTDGGGTCPRYPEWGNACTAAAQTQCGANCNAWSAACMSAVGTSCGAVCGTTGTCAHSNCQVGSALNSTCDSCVAQICALDPGCCSNTWDASCVTKVGSVCNVNCQSGGQCVAWSPDEKNSGCSSADLTMGVPCEDYVHVCNRGTVDVPANTAKIYHWPIGQQAYPTTTPDLSHPQVQTCTIPDAIPVGRCATVATCPGLSANRVMVVNPPNMAGAINECITDNNWTTYKNDGTGKLACKTPECSSSKSQATLATVNMYVMFDKSGSMCSGSASCTAPDATSSWGLTTSALKTFFRDPASAGMNVALRFFPDTVSGSACDSSNCGFNTCGVPLVTLGALGSATASYPPAPTDCTTSTDPHECDLVKAVDSRYPSGGTPIYGALGGALQYMETQAYSAPYQRWVVVFVTDGDPNGCDTDTTHIQQLAQTAYKDFGIVTYTVGIIGSNATFMSDIATAGGGQSFMLSATAADVELVAALNTIRSSSVSCDFPLNQTTALDPSNVSLTFTPTNGTAQSVAKVNSVADCGTGWYFDNPTTPTKITLCPTTCSTVKADLTGKVDVVAACSTQLGSGDIKNTYTATCPSGTVPQWGYLTYAAATPGDGTILFQVRTSDDATTFANEPPPGGLTDVITAHGNVPPFTSNTQVCSMAGPSPCPANVYSALGQVAARRKSIELRTTLTASTTGGSLPVLSAWNVSYSCVDAE